MSEPSSLLRSLDVIFESVVSERDEQFRHADALDTKAGVILGFAGLIVAMGGIGGPYLVLVGQGLAGAAGLLALLAFRPRPFFALGLRALRDQRLTHDPQQTKLELMDTLIEVSARNRQEIVRKSSFLAWSFWLLVAAVGFLLAGTLVDGLKGQTCRTRHRQIRRSVLRSRPLLRRRTPRTPTSSSTWNAISGPRTTRRSSRGSQADISERAGRASCRTPAAYC